MATKIKRLCGYSFVVLFIISFSYVMILSIDVPLQKVFFSSWNFILYSISFVITIFTFLKTMSLFTKKTNYVIMWFLITIIIALQFFLAYTTWMNDYADAFIVHSQANRMLYTDGLFNIQDTGYYEYEYFQVYPNNVMITILHYLVFFIANTFNFQNAFLTDNFFILICIDISILFLLLIIYKEFGTEMVNIFLIFCLTCIPLFSYIFYFYTDTVILPIVSLVVYVYYLYYKKNDKKNNWLLLIIIGFLFAFGYQIKPNVIILLPAIIIHIWLKKNYKKMFQSLIVILAMFIIITPIFSSVYKSFGFEKDSNIELPMTHWIMMGLNKDSNGMYNSKDVNYTKEFETKEIKKKANVQVIEERLKEYSITDFKQLYKEKIRETWTDGTKRYADFVSSPVKPNVVSEYLFGSRKIVFFTLSQLFYIANLLLVCVGAIRFIKIKEFDFSFFANTFLFGVLLFHLIWEAGARYALIATPMMLFSAIYGIQFINELVNEHELLSSKKTRSLSLTLTGIVLLLSTVSIAINFVELSRDKQEVENHVVFQKYGNYDLTISEDRPIKQNFVIAKPFNRIMLPIREEPDPSREYLITIKEKSTDKCLFEEKIDRTKISKEKRYIIDLDNININNKKNTYSLELKEISEKGVGNEITLGTYMDAHYNPFPNLMLFINEKKEKNKNISFFVSTTLNEPILKREILFISLILVFFIHSFSFINLYKRGNS